MTAFADIRVTTPTAGGLAAEYAAIMAAIADPERRAEGLAAFDGARRRFDGWKEYAATRFQQDTTDPAARAARDDADALAPIAPNLETEVKRLALRDPAWLTAALGPHVVALWQSDLTLFEPKIADALSAELRLRARYTELIASARIDIDGTILNLEGLSPYAESLDRPLRRRSALAESAFFMTHGAALDGIFDELVQLRDGMARALGYDNFVPLGYRRMRRTDYDATDVATFRNAVIVHVVPVLAAHFERLRAELHCDTLQPWDERLSDAAGNPVPAGNEAFLRDRAGTMFSRLNPELADFYRTMRDNGLLDLAMRPTKAVGGFCVSLGDEATPFIFANFNGTYGDVEVLTHEMGHAFQCHSSRDLPGFDALWPTAEGAEMHSMSLELLVLPKIECLVGDLAPRAKKHQMVRLLSIVVQCALGDHWQHEIYTAPGLSAQQRRETWSALERLYLPWRRSDDVPYLATGAWWHRTLHFFELPFYFIDYALAGTCALQLWGRSQINPAGAWADYVALCRRGGSAPFRELVAGANLKSPFDPATVAEVARLAESALLHASP